MITSRYISQADLESFAKTKVNLDPDRNKKIREQAQRVRDHIERYINENPDVGFVRTRLSGSLAKRTALRSINDIDIALYVSGTKSHLQLNELLIWIKDKLNVTYKSTDVEIVPPCVVIHFSGTDLDVEIMPVIDENDPDGYGTIFDPTNSKRIRTSIKRHIEFIQKRKAKDKNFSQIARFAKFWAKNKADEDPNFHFRSFLIELVLAKTLDEGVDFSDYQEALGAFFNRILKEDLEDQFIFTDYFPASEFPNESSYVDMEIYDPVEPSNNVSSGYSSSMRQTIVNAADDALDAITYASTATTKGEAVRQWRKIFGPTFNP